MVSERRFRHLSEVEFVLDCFAQLPAALLHRRAFVRHDLERVIHHRLRDAHRRVRMRRTQVHARDHQRNGRDRQGECSHTEPATPRLATNRPDRSAFTMPLESIVVIVLIAFPWCPYCRQPRRWYGVAGSGAAFAAAGASAVDKGPNRVLQHECRLRVVNRAAALEVVARPQCDRYVFVADQPARQNRGERFAVNLQPRR